MIVMMSAAGPQAAQSSPFASQKECMAAAELLVAMHPRFELRTGAGAEERGAGAPARPYVACIKKPPAPKE